MYFIMVSVSSSLLPILPGSVFRVFSVNALDPRLDWEGFNCLAKLRLLSSSHLLDFSGFVACTSPAIERDLG